MLLCEIAGVSKAAYYKWLNRTPSFRETENEEMIQEMMAIHEKVEEIYGYRRMKLNIQRIFGMRVNHKRIYRLMKIARIESVIRRKKRKYKRSDPQHIAENVLNREFTAEKPKRKVGY